MRMRVIGMGVYIALLGLLVIGCSGSGETQKEGGMMKQEGYTDEYAERLDELVRQSTGDYLHIQVGPCFGSCEMTVSIYKDDPEKHYYVYEAESHKYNEVTHKTDLLRLRKPIDEKTAKELLGNATSAGLFDLVADGTMAITDQPYIWVRARIGDKTLALDKVYTGGESYITERMDGSPSLAEVYVNVRVALVELLFSLP